MACDDFWLALWALPGVGSTWFHRLRGYFGTPEKVFSASKRDLLSVPGIKKKVADNIYSSEPLNIAESIKKRVCQIGGRVISLEDSEYPMLLKEVFLPPPVIFVKGSLEIANKPGVSIVGPRLNSLEGKKEAIRLSKELSQLGVIVVSGLARGIDTAAHQGALMGGGHTLAVLGTGIDVYYPPGNEGLQDKITENGAIMSIFPPGTTPRKENFPIRNRVVSGISFGVIVVEAGEKSGGLITARYALEEGRDVCVVKGTLHLPENKGCKKLFMDGARIVDSGADVIEKVLRREVLPSEVNNAPPLVPSDLSEFEERVWKTLDCDAKSMDQIVGDAELAPRDVAIVLTELQRRALVKIELGLYSLL